MHRIADGGGIAARAARLLAAAGLTLVLVSCGEQGRFGTAAPGGGTTGTGAGAPGVVILQPTTANLPVPVGDSVLVEFRASDDKGVLSVDMRGVAVRGDVNLGTDTTVNRFVQRTVAVANKRDTTLTRYLRATPGDSTSEVVYIIVTATDSSGNTGSDTATVRITNGPRLTILKPENGSETSTGKSITIQIQAVDPQGVRVVGWRATGVLTQADSVIQSSASGALPDTVVFTDTLTVPSGTATGNLSIAAFGVDSTGDASASATPVAVTVKSAASDVTPPLVSFTVGKRVEGDDSLVVHATDASGISRVGFVVRVVGATTVLAADSVTHSGNLTDVTDSMNLRLDTITTFPKLVTVEAFAVDSVGNRGVSTFGTVPVSSTQTAAKDTITVVAGKTFALPAGGSIADAIFNRNRNELYLSNQALNRLEVFQVASNSFLAGGIPVGSKPWGLALWPRDTLGSYGDTVIVANSGGTNLSIVDVSAAGRVERRRHRLPNYVVQKVQTATDPTNSTIVFNITEFDFADRPQYVGTACRSACAQVFAIYSTTPTQAQGLAGRGYLAWEELTASAASPNGHFFWEPATSAASLATDTIQVISVRDTAPGQARRDTVLGSGAGVMGNFDEVGFRDSTFVRNSGDFNHALIGEGGQDVTFARAFTWDARAGTTTITGTSCTLLGVPIACTGTRDNGISEGVFVRDLLGNRAARVTSVATNFNGRTNFVRADSIYVFDWTLRLTGLLQVGGQNPGMDANPSHKFDAGTRGSGGFGGTGSPNNRLVYAARPDANIEVFDTYWYASVAIIPVRDPIIGPVRVALNGSGQQVLVGVTASGVVVVPLATVNNPYPVRSGVSAGATR